MNLLAKLRNGDTLHIGYEMTAYRVRGGNVYEITNNAAWADGGVMKFQPRESEALAKFFTKLAEDIATEERNTTQNESLAAQKKSK